MGGTTMEDTQMRGETVIYEFTSAKHKKFLIAFIVFLVFALGCIAANFVAAFLSGGDMLAMFLKIMDGYLYAFIGAALFLILAFILLGKHLAQRVRHVALTNKRLVIEIQTRKMDDMESILLDHIVSFRVISTMSGYTTYVNTVKESYIIPVYDLAFHDAITTLFCERR